MPKHRLDRVKKLFQNSNDVHNENGVYSVSTRKLRKSANMSQALRVYAVFSFFLSWRTDFSVHTEHHNGHWRFQGVQAQRVSRVCHTASTRQHGQRALEGQWSSGMRIVGQYFGFHCVQSCSRSPLAFLLCHLYALLCDSSRSHTVAIQSAMNGKSSFSLSNAHRSLPAE